MSTAISITYELNLPADTPVPDNHAATKTHEFSVANANAAGQKEYYAGLRAAVLQAKSTLGEELTAWRDVVGKREENKEAKIPRKNEEDEDEDEEAEE